MGKDEILKFIHSSYPLSNGVYQLTEPPESTFEAAYLEIRSKEGRLLTNDQIKRLPGVSVGHPHYSEWQIRARSAMLLREYLSHHQQKVLLELGCGNGWLTNYLAQTSTLILGVDINRSELETAARLFEMPIFGYGNIMSVDLQMPPMFDAVVVASAFQYFSDTLSLFECLLRFVKPGGEIHIVDTPIYATKERAEAASRRTMAYYRQLGVNIPSHYFHHSWEDLEGINYNVLYKPTSFPTNILRKLKMESRPFPWIMVKKAGNS